MPVRVRITRQDRMLEPGSDALGTGRSVAGAPQAIVPSAVFLTRLVEFDHG
jgi:hypothetical protein